MEFVLKLPSQRNSNQGESSNIQGRKLDSKDLPSLRRLGKGLSGYLYETSWQEKKYIRKDFPLGSVHYNVFEKEAIALVDLVHANLVRCPHYTVGKSSCSLLLEYVDDDLLNIIQKKIEAQQKGNQRDSSTTLHSRVSNTNMAKQWEIIGANVGHMKMPEDESFASFEVREAVDIISSIAIGMKYLHDYGIVHGDLKPQNVLVGNHGIVKLVDFGLVETKKRVKLVSKHTRHYEILMWKAPELFEELLGPILEYSDDPFSDEDTNGDEEIESSVIFTKSKLAMADVYSFGLVCSQILGGNPLYSNLSLTQLRRQRMDGCRLQLPSSCPDGLRSLIFSSVECDPQCRPIFADICNTLEAFQSNKQPRLLKDHEALEIGSKEMDMEEVDRVVMEKSDLSGPRDELPRYLKIDLTAITIAEPRRPVVLRSKRDKVNKLGSDFLVHIGKWIGCDFAVKVFRSASAGRNKKQLLMEVGPLLNLQHPHIVRLVGFAQDAEQCVVLMELMDTDLRSFMRKKLESFSRPKPRPFKRPEELNIITQISKAMHYMHTQEYVHGNLKCSHILVKKFDDYLEVKIADFGASQKLGKVRDAEAFKQARQTRRTRWTAPEAIDLYGVKQPKASSELLKKSDVYSFGMTCYEVVTGKHPFDGIKKDELLKHIHAGVRPELPDDLDDDLKGLIKRCWDHNPSERPEFGEIIFILSFIMSKEPSATQDKFSREDMAKISTVYGALGKVWQGKEHSHKDNSSEEGDGGIQRSDSTLHFSIPENLRIQRHKLNIVRCIGSGSFAAVYEAVWLGCMVAVKKFRFPTSSFNIRTLQQEVDFLISINHHPCIVQMFGLSVDSDQRFSIVMELMDGDLHDLIESQMIKRVLQFDELPLKGVVVPFELHEAVPIISKIALGMAFLHSKGIVHRVLNLSNVLTKGRPESIDVRLAGFCQSLHEFEIEGPDSYLRIGTGFWRAPEVFTRGDHLKKPDLKAADVYSFAVICYQVLTGITPFSNLDPKEYIRVINGERPTLPALLHPGLKALVQQCWHADPVKRPNFTEICEELQKIQQSLPSFSLWSAQSHLGAPIFLRLRQNP